MVLLGASGVLANGAVLAPAGTATVAALAKTRDVDVWVAAESFKLSERVHLDSVVYNEMGSEYVRDPHLFPCPEMCSVLHPLNDHHAHFHSYFT